LIFEGLFHILKASMVFTREDEDVATIGFHMAPLDEGVIRDAPASNAQMDLVAARLRTFWDAIDGFYQPTHAYDRLVFHDAGPLITNEKGQLRGIDYNPDGSRVPGQPPANPALRTDIIAGAPGTSDNPQNLPEQVAMSVTLKTQFRPQWGRVYLPAGDVNTVQVGSTHAAGIGQIDSDVVTAIRNAAGVLLEGLSDDNVPLVVWSTKHQHALSVDQVQVDSIFDVIRSRRVAQAKTRLTHTLGA
jgi:hypothetical protein